MSRAFAGGGVAGADGDRDVRDGHRPRARRRCAMPASGARRLRSTSYGERLERRDVEDGDAGARRLPLASASGGRAVRWSRHQRKAARVLPEPVGARSRVCSPREMASQPSSCARVGAAKLSRNQARAAGPKCSRTGAGWRRLPSGYCARWRGRRTGVLAEPRPNPRPLGGAGLSIGWLRSERLLPVVGRRATGCLVARR